MKNHLALVLVLLIAACGTRVDYLRTNEPPRTLAARSPNEVEVFTSKVPDRPYVEVGIVETQQQSVYSVDAPDAVFGMLREEAARQGCDALILLGSNDAVQFSSVAYGSGGGKTLKGYRGTCAVYKDAPQAARP